MVSEREQAAGDGAVRFLQAIDRRGSVGPQVYEALRGAILDLSLKPGEALSEKTLSLELGVSRTPVREAFIRLAREGLVVVYAQMGTFVSKIDLADVEEARFVRSTLETAAIADAMSPTPEDVAELRANIARQRALAPDGPESWAGIYELDEQLHRKLIEISRHPLVWQSVHVPLLHMERVRRLSMPFSGQIPGIKQLPEIVDEHERIVEAVARADRQGAVDAMADHLGHVSEVAEALAAELPEYFEQGKSAPVA